MKIQIANNASEIKSDVHDSSVATSSTPKQVIGLVYVLSACISSGFAGVYYEKLVKSGSQPSVIIRNLQMGKPNNTLEVQWKHHELIIVFDYPHNFSGLIALPLSGVAVLFNVREIVFDRGFFHGYNNLVVTVVFLQAAGGLLVAVVVKYADNILKGFATSGSIVLNGIVSAMVNSSGLVEHLSAQFIGGAAIVVISTMMYHAAPQVPSTGVRRAADIENGPVISRNSKFSGMGV